MIRPLFSTFVLLLLHHFFYQIIQAEKYIQHLGGQPLGVHKRNGRNPGSVGVNVPQITPQ
jgi:hypothetical protein